MKTAFLKDKQRPSGYESDALPAVLHQREPFRADDIIPAKKLSVKRNWVILKNVLINLKTCSKIHLSFVLHLGAEQGRTSRGDSGALYLQSALAGMNPGPRTYVVSTDLDKQR